MCTPLVLLILAISFVDSCSVSSPLNTGINTVPLQCQHKGITVHHPRSGAPGATSPLTQHMEHSSTSSQLPNSPVTPSPPSPIADAMVVDVPNAPDIQHNASGNGTHLAEPTSAN
ncbi:hypothetical protein BDN71DRAFT_1431860 [Pleurotus eryngii]|uniref:Uncharacterized protein n=1 Tax=Pleurotus eryngii TaxID=5323 RepID=A0A9P6DFY6_PLEER|nr:hypothetical protein BDN71DRAFT_1431860 [Pleurotus eryngii]